MRRIFPALMLLLPLAAAGSLNGQDTGTAQQPSTAAPASAAAQAAVPRLIMFSGTLRDLAGKPVTGPVDVTFGLYSEETDGSPLWYETQTLQADRLGHYNVMLGAMSPTGVPMELFTSGRAHWLGVQVGNLPEQPRVLLVSVPYAMKAGDAESLGGKPASAYMLSSQANAQAASAASAATLSGLTTSGATKTATSTESPVTNAFTQSYIPVYSDNLGNTTNSIMMQSGTKLGINTNAPAFNLDVNGNAFAVGTKTAAEGAGGTIRFRDDTGTQHWLFGLPGSAGSQDFQMYNYTNGHAPLYIENGAPSYSFYFNSAGKVGVLTNSPAFPLDVNGSVLGIGTKTAKAGYGGAIRFRDDTGTVRWALGLPGSAGATDFFLSNLVTGTAPFYVEAAAPASTIYIKSTGQVGIGTPSPGQKLSVVGVVESTSGGFKFPDGSIQTTASTGGGTASDLTCSGCVSSSEVSFNYAGSASKGGDATNSLLLNGLASSAFATLSGTNPFTGNNSFAGTVGIGTASPVSTLHVLTSGTTPEANSVFAGDAVAGECAGTGCSAVDGVSQGSGGVGVYAASTSTYVQNQSDAGTGIIASTYDLANGWAGYFIGDISLWATPGAGIFMMSPDGTHCASLTLANTGANLVFTPQTCPSAGAVSNKLGSSGRPVVLMKQPSSRK